MDHVIIGSNDLDEGDLYVELTEEEISEVLVALGANSTLPQGNNVQSDHCFLHDNDDPTLGVSIEAPHQWNCYDGDTELLTQQGWVRFKDYDGTSPVLQVFESGKASFIRPSNFRKGYRECLHLKSESLDLVVSKKHRMFAGYRKRKVDTQPSWREVLAEDFKRSHWSRGHVEGVQQLGGLYRPELLRLAVAYQADGTPHHSGGAVFQFTKTRKILRLSKLLNDAGIEYTKNAGYFYIPRSDTWDEVARMLGGKTFSLRRLLHLGNEARKIFCQEIYCWDGCKRWGYVYYNTCKASVDCVQTAFALQGVRTSVLWSEKAGQWTVRLIKAKFSRGGRGFISDPVGRKAVYGLEVPSSWLLVRRADKIVVSGNCFNPICRKGVTIFSLIAAARGITLRQAREWLYQRFPKIRTADRPFKLLEEAGEKREHPRFTLPPSVLAAYSLSADNGIGYRAIDYWGKCSREQADEYKLGYDRKHHRIIVPVFHEDNVLAGLVGRTMLKGVVGNRWYNYDKGKFKTGRAILGIHRPIKDAPIVVVEGPGDYINLTAMGIPNVYCIFGSEFTNWQVDNIVKWNKPVVPMFDFDKPGFIAKRKFIKAVAHRVKIWGFEYPSAAFDENGKADPGAIPHDEAEFLLSTFSEATKIKRLH
ncbi:MAG: toprim domain-containing protein [Candidatus Altiarchaeales archaeon]|nr:toprim domain-containing protein [Candidatus Altiarchaeales archaeon]